MHVGERPIRRAWVPTVVGAAALLAACAGDPEPRPETGSASDPDHRGDPAGSGIRDEPAPDPGHGTAPLFRDVTSELGLRFDHVCGASGRHWLPEEMGPGAALFDYDGDGDPDLFLVQGGDLQEPTRVHPSRLFRNDGAAGFTDVSEASGASLEGSAPGYGMGCSAADYDGDGDVDLYVTRVGPNVLLRNDGDGTFTDVTEEAGVGDPGFGTSAAFLDYDRDGDLDLFVVNYVDWSAAKEGTCYDPRGLPDYCSPLVYESPTPDRLYRNLGGGRFADASVESGVASARGNGLGIVCTDLDDDGWVDVYVANDQTPAFLWLNQRDGTFREEALFRGGAYNMDGMAIAGMGVAAEDLDADLDFDLVITNIHDQAHLCLRNSGGSFQDVSRAWGFGGWGVPFTGFGVALFDQDHDGRLDGLVANGAVNRRTEPFEAGNPYAEPNQFIRADASGRFRDASVEAGPALQGGMSRGLALGDLDGDGDLDAVITNNRGPVQVLRNENRSGLAWSVLDLRPARGGRDALHARALVHAGGRTQLREVRPHSSYLTSHDPRLHFGLGPATRIDSLEVRWPGGRTEVWRDLPVNEALTLHEGTAPGRGRAGR